MASSEAKSESDRVTAGVLIIGDEILSGRTQDTNLRDIARYLGVHGVDLAEARTVPDVHEEIIAALNALRRRYDYVITTGGIGPTHDDITADAVAAAFGVELIEHPDIIAQIEARVRSRPGAVMNAAMRRMARVPVGGELVRSSVAAPPGFTIGNVFVLAGVPTIMRAMLDDVGHRLKGGVVTVSRTVRVEGSGESVIAEPLEAVAKAHPAMSLGSYPFFNEGVYGSNLVLRARDPDELAATVAELIAALRGIGVENVREIDASAAK